MLMQNLNDSLIFWYSSIVWKQIITVAWHKQRRIKDKACHITCQLFWAVRHILVYLNALDNGLARVYSIIGKLTPSYGTVTDLICFLFVITLWWCDGDHSLYQDQGSASNFGVSQSMRLEIVKVEREQSMTLILDLINLFPSFVFYMWQSFIQPIFWFIMFKHGLMVWSLPSNSHLLYL